MWVSAAAGTPALLPAAGDSYVDGWLSPCLLPCFPQTLSHFPSLFYSRFSSQRGFFLAVLCVCSQLNRKLLFPPRPFSRALWTSSHQADQDKRIPFCSSSALGAFCCFCKFGAVLACSRVMDGSLLCPRCAWCSSEEEEKVSSSFPSQGAWLHLIPASVHTGGAGIATATGWASNRQNERKQKRDESSASGWFACLERSHRKTGDAKVLQVASGASE